MSGTNDRPVKTFQVSLVAPGHDVFVCKAQLVTVPGETGDLGVMFGHLPLLTTMRVGVMHIVCESGQVSYFGVTGGFFEMMGDHAVILADQLIEPREVEADPSAASFGGKPLFCREEYPSETAKIDLAKALLARRLAEVSGKH